MTEKLISRDRELLTLKDGLKNVRSGKGGIFVLTGEAGFGKTYLIDKFLDLCKDKDDLETCSGFQGHFYFQEYFLSGGF